MSGLLSMTLNYDPTPPVYRRGAVTTLKAAQSVLKLLASIERGVTGKPARLVWDVNIYSLSDRAVIEFNPVGDRKTGDWARQLITEHGIDPEKVAGAVREGAL